MIKKIFSVIVHYNTPDDVIRLSDQLVNMSYPDHEVIVVDNCSEEENKKILHQELKNINNVTVINAKKNGGFGYGVNSAFKYISDKKDQSFLLHVINSDSAVLNNEYLDVLAGFLSGKPDAGVIGPKVYADMKGQVQNTIMPFTSLKSILGFKKQYSAVNRSQEAKEPVVVECLNGVCFMVTSEVFHKAGGFDEGYFMYNEEHDLCFKVNQLGFNNYFIPVQSIMHIGAGSENGVEELDWRFQYKRRNQVRYISIHKSKWEALTVAVMFSITAASKFYKRKRKGISYTGFVKELFKNV